MKRISIRAFVGIGVLGTMAHVLMMLNFPLPPFPNFLLVLTSATSRRSSPPCCTARSPVWRSNY